MSRFSELGTDPFATQSARFYTAAPRLRGRQKGEARQTHGPAGYADRASAGSAPRRDFTRAAAWQLGCSRRVETRRDYGLHYGGLTTFKSPVKRAFKNQSKHRLERCVIFFVQILGTWNSRIPDRIIAVLQSASKGRDKSRPPVCRR